MKTIFTLSYLCIRRLRFISLISISLVISGTSWSQTIRGHSYAIQQTPFDNARSIASSSDKTIVVTADRRTFIYDSDNIWFETALEEEAPSTITSYRDNIVGVNDGWLTVFESNSWIQVLPTTGRIKPQDGFLYNIFQWDGDLLIRRTTNLEEWELVSEIQNFSEHMGGFYDFAADGETFIVSGISGNFFYTTDGLHWSLGNVGPGDRLHTVEYFKGRFIFGGTIGNIYSTEDLEAFDYHHVGTVTHKLYKFGGFLFGIGGSNPDRGKLFYTTDLEDWVSLNGVPIPSMASVTHFNRTILFLGSNAESSTIAEAYYDPPTVRTEVSNNLFSLELETKGLIEYVLMESQDLKEWKEAEEFDLVEEINLLKWRIPVDDLDRGYFKIGIR